MTADSTPWGQPGPEPSSTGPRARAALRIVVVGFGPVAARLVDELLPAVSTGSIHLTVIGEEEEAAYNRVLVADLGVGRTTAEALQLTDPKELLTSGVNLIRNQRVTRVDRARRRVLLANGTTLNFDRLVLATGSKAVIPNLTGLNPDPRNPGLPQGVTTLRTLADAEVLRSAVSAGRRVIVLGGGILGLEAAIAVAEEGAAATLVFNGPHALGRNIDRGGGSVLGDALRNSGVALSANARSTGVECDPQTGAFKALILEAQEGKAESIEGDLLLLSCGVRPNIELAEGAGLPTARGILVDHRLRAHHEPSIYAIGDCAEVRCPEAKCAECLHSPGPTGLIGPAWRQAEWLAQELLSACAGILDVPGEPQENIAPERPALILLKARGVNLALAGQNMIDPWDAEALSAGTAPGQPPLSVSQWADPEHGRYVKMTTRAGVLEGMVCVGMPRTASELVMLFERGAELPADRSLLLRLDGAAASIPTPGGGSATLNDPAATVCRCAGVSVQKIGEAAAQGCSSVAEISRATRAGTGCGGCHSDIKTIIEQHFQPTAA
ncbi:FAD-dependent oxidoreductase [Pseudarthrobacter sp. J1763]|uniref:FAD-dependent oxidoreductase n=1 Tax=Pseudarthrobacter sp. J1763 TaxID=3420445 RepID=UPI003D2A5718